MVGLMTAAESAAKRLKFQFPYKVDEWVESPTIENYHKHTAWSNLTVPDSATLPEDLLDLCVKRGCKNYFSGEHGFQGEWIMIYDLCKNSPLNFRYSVEAYWVKDRNKIITETYEDKNGDLKTREVKDRTNCHMVLVARNYRGLRKLNYVLSVAATDGFYYRPRIDLDLLFTLDPEDVYVTSACIAGWQYPDAEDVWLKIWRHFGDSFFLEYQANNTEKQIELNKKIYAMSQKYGIQTIIGLDTHYLNDEDRVKRDNILKRKGVSYPEEEGWYMDFPDGTELLRRMREQAVLPDEEILYAMMNTHVFTSGCEEIVLDTDFKIPIHPGYKDLSYDERTDVLKGILNERYRAEPVKSKERIEGVQYEVGEIKDSGTTDYFIDNYAIVKTATSPEYGGHLTPTSRGSAASYYTSKLLGFTTMDRFDIEVPIYPQRFITKDRILASHQMPDIDLNVESQEPFQKAAKDIFGEYSCYPLLAVGKLGEKSGFKLYADIKGVEASIANEISKSIDQYNEALKQADDEDRDQISVDDFITDKKLLQVFNESKPYQGIPEQAKVHACGFCLFNGNPREPDVIGYGDIRYEIGLMRCHSEKTGKSVVVVVVEGGFLDSHGYVKDDFLIVDVVGIIRKLYESIGRQVPTTTELRKMVENDPETWKMYAMGATCCLNQCEKAATTKKVMIYKPKSIKELAAFIAGIRPGFKSLIDNFIARKPYSNGEPVIDSLLEDSFHYMLYQEAVMKIFNYLGIPMKDSYDTIKKISKKKLKGEALKHVEDTLEAHWLENIGNTENFAPVYKVIKDSARYSFNAPHAVAMANDSLYEAWMKAHHTAKFYEVTLNHYDKKNDKDKIAELEMEACKYFGYEMGTYEYGKDNTRFVVDEKEKKIYPSLAAVKGIGKKALADLYVISQKTDADFVDLYLSTAGTKVNATVFTRLVQIGYFSRFGTVKKLEETMNLVKHWKGTGWAGRKTISKEDAKALGLTDKELRTVATDETPGGNISEKRYTVKDWKGLVKLLAKKIPDEEYPLNELLKYQIEILGYIAYKNKEFPKSLIAITNLDTRYSPKFQAYCLRDGQIAEMKVRKNRKPTDKKIRTSFSDEPFEDGDVILIKKAKEEKRKTKSANGWVPIPGAFDWWIYDYEVVRNL